MTIGETIISAIIEIAAYLFAQAVRHTFHLEPKKAESIGGYIVFGLIVVAAIFVTVVYS